MLRMLFYFLFHVITEKHEWCNQLLQTNRYAFEKEKQEKRKFKILAFVNAFGKVPLSTLQNSAANAAD